MGEMGKKEKKNLTFLGFLLHNVIHHCQGVNKIWTLALIAGEKSVVNFYETERKMDK